MNKELLLQVMLLLNTWNVFPYRRASRRLTADRVRRVVAGDPDSINFDPTLNCSDAERHFITGFCSRRSSSLAHLSLQSLLPSLLLRDRRILPQAPVSIAKLDRSSRDRDNNGTRQYLFAMSVT